MDASVLYLRGGVFMTLAMAGNNRLGGQDFNDRVHKHLLRVSCSMIFFIVLFFCFCF